MLTAIGVALAGGLAAILAGYIMWRTSQHSGMAAMVAGILCAIAAFAGAILIAWLMTRAYVPH